MNFMNKDEYLLLMSFNETEVINPVPTLTIEERIKLRNVGIQTAIEYPRWYAIEPSRGQYDFSSIDGILHKNRESGLKTIFSVYGAPLPDWMPDAWFSTNKEGEVNREAISLWNSEAQSCAEDLYMMLLFEFAALDVMFVLGEYMEGEAILPCGDWFYDVAAIEDYKYRHGSEAYPDINNSETLDWLLDTALEHCVERQKIFWHQREEIWNMQQWLMNQWSPGTINYAQGQILHEYQEMFSGANLVLLQYTYFDESHPEENVIYVDSLKKDYGLDVIVEAHFCGGLKTTTPKAIAKGFRGQILGPIHGQSGQTRMEEWMYAEVQNSIKLWEQSHENSSVNQNS